VIDGRDEVFLDGRRVLGPRFLASAVETAFGRLS